jgi:tryptophan 2,3-dioxygenase
MGTQNLPPVHYASYLQLDKILSAQSPESKKHSPTGTGVHDEMLFIITHQSYELWFKQIHFELDSIMGFLQKNCVKENELRIILQRSQRLNVIIKHLLEQFAILETMTPLDFLEFRNYLFPASGFQSFQFRALENKLGHKLKNRKDCMSLNGNDPKNMTKPSSFDISFYLKNLTPTEQKELLVLEDTPSFFDLVQTWLERIPFLEIENPSSSGEKFNFFKSYQESIDQMTAIDEKHIQSHPFLSSDEKKIKIEEIKKNREHFHQIINITEYEKFRMQKLFHFSHRAFMSALFISLYRDEPALQRPFDFLCSLLNLDGLMTSWRQRHAQLAHRMLGTKIGTGGSSGYQYLKKAADAPGLFQDLHTMSTYLIPRENSPKLPQYLVEQMGLHFDFQKVTGINA